MDSLYNNRFLRRLDFGGNPKSVNEMLVDSFIIGGIAFFSNLAGSGFPPKPGVVWSAGVALCLAFFTQLAYERQKRSVKKSKQNASEEAGDD